MVMAGVEKGLLDTEQSKRLMQDLLKGNQEIKLPSDEDAKVKQAVFIFNNSKVGVDGKKKVLAHCMQLAGCTAEERVSGGSKLYMQSSRLAKILQKAEQAERDLQSRAPLTSMTEGSNQGTWPGTENPLLPAPVSTINLFPYNDEVQANATAARNMDSSESEEEEEEEEFYMCCANNFCVFDKPIIHKVEEAHACFICQHLCHLNCGTEVNDAVDESLVFACKECHANFF
jgi:hypothetical protein